MGKSRTAAGVATSEGKGAPAIGLGLAGAAFRASDAVPESRNFGDAGADQDPLRAIRGTHINGIAAEEWAKGMPPEIVARMSYSLTDEGLVEQQRLNREDTMRLPFRGEVATDPVEKRIMQRDAELEQGFDPLLAVNPMEEVVAPYKRPGFSYKFLSEFCMKHLGQRGYKIVKDSNGQPVRMADLILGEIPQAIAEGRQKKAAQESEDLVKGMSEQYADSVSRLKHEAKDMGLRVLEPGEMSGDFVNSETGRRIEIG